MIVEGLITALKTVVFALFDILPDLPAMPAVITNGLSTAVDLIRDGCGIVALFLPWSFVMVIMGVYIALENYDKVLLVLRWILKKIPFIQIEL